MRSRPSRTQTFLPAPERSRAAARPAAPAPMTMTSNRSCVMLSEAKHLAGEILRFAQHDDSCRKLLADDFSPRQLADGEHFFIDLALRGLLPQDPAKVIHFRRDQPVVFR